MPASTDRPDQSIPPADAAPVDVVVIGAGQGGLATAAHLRRAGFAPVDRPEPGSPTFVVLDAADGPGGAWRDRWPGLTMGTVHSVYELPGRRLPQFAPELSASTALSGYFADYERDEGLAVRRPVQVRSVRDASDGSGRLIVDSMDRTGRPVGSPSGDDGLYAEDEVEPIPAPDVLAWGAGSARPVLPPVPVDHLPSARPEPVAEPSLRRVRRVWSARAVVNATGTWTRPFWPVYPGQRDFDGSQLHTHDYRDPEDFAGKRVIVVGGGASAVQHLLAIHPVARGTAWVTRRPPEWVADEFSPELGREAVARVEARTRAGLPPGSVVSATGLSLTHAYRKGIATGVLRARPMFARLVPDGAVWTAQSAGTDPQVPLAEGWAPGPEHIRADVVLWATGFRPAVDHLAPLRLRHRDGGIELDGTTAVADPRVQLVGYGPSASTVGANRAGRTAAQAVGRLIGLPEG